MRSKPDTMTRLLDTIAALGGDVEELLGWQLHDKDGQRYWFMDTEHRFAMDHLDTTPTEIMAAAFVLEGMLLAAGWCQYVTIANEHQWLRHGLGPEHPDRIEALLLAGEKLREGSK